MSNDKVYTSTGTIQVEIYKTTPDNGEPTNSYKVIFSPVSDHTYVLQSKHKFAIFLPTENIEADCECENDSMKIIEPIAAKLNEHGIPLQLSENDKDWLSLLLETAIKRTKIDVFVKKSSKLLLIGFRSPAVSSSKAN